MQSIKTKYLPATNNLGRRIKVVTSGGLKYTHKLGSENALHDEDETKVITHHEAVAALVDHYQLDWDISTLCYGGLELGTIGFTFTFPESACKL
jgi:hypothetical protein